jgi:hypothetical protein
MRFLGPFHPAGKVFLDLGMQPDVDTGDLMALITSKAPFVCRTPIMASSGRVRFVVTTECWSWI